jgi:WD40 repeat protein
MQDSTLTDARLDSCLFKESDLRDVKHSRYPDFKGHINNVTSLAFSPDGKFLVSGSVDKILKLWNVES